MNASNAQKNLKHKIERKLFGILLALFFIIVFPFIRHANHTFARLYQITFLDVFKNTAHNWLTTLPLFYIFLSLVLFYVIIIFFILLKSKTLATDQQLKSTYKTVDIIAFFVYLIALYILINGLFFSFAHVDGTSMEPTFEHNDYVIMQRIYRRKERLDFVVVKPGDIDENYLIKRIIGLPGETINIEGGHIYIDGHLLEEPYLPNITATECENANYICTIELADDEYYLLGDNREKSSDSRDFGPITEDRLYGVVKYRLFPLKNFGRIE